MRPTQHPSNNLVLGAPSGWDQSESACHALAVTTLPADDSGPAVVMSWWRPTDAELRALIAGHTVRLSVVGERMPPVSIEVTP